MKFCSLVALLSVLVHCVFQVLASKCSTHLIIIIIWSNFFEDCPFVNDEEYIKLMGVLVIG